MADPLRPGHELQYHPGETNFRRADLLLLNKAARATQAQLEQLQEHAATYNPGATVLLAESEVSVPDPEALKGKRVLCIDDGPTLTHGEMPYGAGRVAAEKYGAKEIVDPRPFAIGSLAETLAKFPHIESTLPAMGYFPEQIQDLEASIAQTPCDLVLIATPTDLGRVLKIDKPHTRVRYAYKEHGSPTLLAQLQDFLSQLPASQG